MTRTIGKCFRMWSSFTVRDMRIEHAGNGIQALTYLEEWRDEDLPVIMMVDYQMPDMTGAELLTLRGTRSRCHNIMKIMWSTSDREEYVDRCKQLGASAYYRKRNNIAELTKVMNYLLLQCYALLGSYSTG